MANTSSGDRAVAGLQASHQTTLLPNITNAKQVPLSFKENILFSATYRERDRMGTDRVQKIAHAG